MASSNSGARAIMLAHQMQLQASLENKPNHIQHVKDQIDYTNAVAETYNEQWEQWVKTELPQMVNQAVDNYMKSREIQLKVDEQSAKVAKAKVSEIIQSLFR